MCLACDDMTLQELLAHEAAEAEARTAPTREMASGEPRIDAGPPLASALQRREESPA